MRKGGAKYRLGLAQSLKLAKGRSHGGIGLTLGRDLQRRDGKAVAFGSVAISASRRNERGMAPGPDGFRRHTDAIASRLAATAFLWGGRWGGRRERHLARILRGNVCQQLITTIHRLGRVPRRRNENLGPIVQAILKGQRGERDLHLTVREDTFAKSDEGRKGDGIVEGN